MAEMVYIGPGSKGKCVVVFKGRSSGAMHSLDDIRTRLRSAGVQCWIQVSASSAATLFGALAAPDGGTR